MARVDDWDDEPTPGSTIDPVSTSNDSSELPVLRYTTVDEFVRDFLAEVLWFDTGTNARIWCPQWWRHPAAIVRLEALHRSFEQLRRDPGVGISTWLRDHADPHMSVLSDPAGPFKGCSVAKGHDDRPRVIAVVPAPEGLFEHDD